MTSSSAHVTSVDSFCLTLVAQLVVHTSCCSSEPTWIRPKDCRPPPTLRLCLLCLVSQLTLPGRRRPPQSTGLLPRPARTQSAVTLGGHLRLQLPRLPSAHLRAFRQLSQQSPMSRRSTIRRREFFRPIWEIRCRSHRVMPAGHEHTRSLMMMYFLLFKGYS